MGAPAIAQPAAAPVTPQSPSAAPETTAPAQTPAPTGDGAPAGSQAQPATPSPKVPDDRVPYPRFREVQTNLTRAQRENEQLRQERQAETQRLQNQIAQYERDVQEYRDLQQIINENPELGQQLIDLVSGRTTGRGAVARGPAAAPAVLPKELVDKIDRMDRFTQTQAQRDQAMREQQELAQTSQQLHERLTGILKEADYEPEFIDDLREFVIDKINTLARQNRETTLEDVPWLAGQWFKKMENFYNKRFERFRAGKQADATLPASPGPAAAPVTPATSTDAFGPETNRRLLEGLKTKLGWGATPG